MGRGRNESKLSRRTLLQAAAVAPAAGLTAVVEERAAKAGNGDSVYTRVGVRPFINMTATYTINGGTLTLPEVKRAMEEASHFSVNLDELMEHVGARIAELLAAESAIVTSGAASALMLATAAAIAGADPEKMLQLPDTSGLRGEVVMQKQSRNQYDHAIRSAGAQIVEVDGREEFHAALGRRTAMIAILGTGEAKGKVRLEEAAEAARKLGIPVLVDAAAELPLAPNPYLSRGATLVAYSGGKIIRGPQCAGLLLGRKDLIRAAWLNGAPHHSVGRMMKVGKEEVMGMLAAIEAWKKRDLQAEYREWESRMQEMSRVITKVDGVRTQMMPPAGASPFPVMNVEWDPQKIALTAGEIGEQLLAGEPRVMSHATGEGHSFVIRPVTIKLGDHLLAAKRLHEIFSSRRRTDKLHADPAPPAPPIADLSGRWEVEIEYDLGRATHTLALEARGGKVTGMHLGRKLRGSVSGIVNGDKVRLRSGLPGEGSTLSYSFTGQIRGDAMSGEVALGEYGKARWSARRLV